MPESSQHILASQSLRCSRLQVRLQRVRHTSYLVCVCPADGLFLFLRAVIVMGSGGEVDRAKDLTIDRMKQTLLGVVIFLFMGNVVFPVSARSIALWSIIDTLNLLRRSTKTTLASFTSFVHTEAARFKSRRRRRLNDEALDFPPHQPLAAVSELQAADVLIVNFPDVLADASSEPALWRMPFSSLSPRYHEIIASAKRASNGIRLIYHCIDGLHQQASLREQKLFAKASSSIPASIHSPLLDSTYCVAVPINMSHNVSRRVALSTFSFDTTSCLSRGFLAFEPLMKVTEDLSTHLDEILEVRFSFPG